MDIRALSGYDGIHGNKVKKGLHGHHKKAISDDVVEISKQSQTLLERKRLLESIKAKVASGFYFKNPEVDEDLYEKMSNMFKNDFFK
ncbi:MAG: hypothetical protein AB1633_07875 [Elusimicrobiota bacterium]